MKDKNERMLNRNWQNLIQKTKKRNDNVESASYKAVVSIVDKSAQNVVFEPDIEDEPNIDFYNTLEVPNDEDEPCSDTPRIHVTSNVVDCATQTSNDKNLCSKLFMRNDYFENFMMNILNLNTMFSQNFMVKSN